MLALAQKRSRKVVTTTFLLSRTGKRKQQAEQQGQQPRYASGPGALLQQLKLIRPKAVKVTGAAAARAQAAARAAGRVLDARLDVDGVYARVVVARDRCAAAAAGGGGSAGGGSGTALRESVVPTGTGGGGGW